MAQSVATTPRLIAPRAPTLDAVRTFTGGAWDVDAFHAMERRDETLIQEELLHGHLSSAFLYNFKIQGQDVIGISVIGARHLASQYGGIQHRLVSSVRKKGALFIFQTYPSLGIPMQVTSAILPDLEDEDDFYGCLCEVKDIKTGNTIQVEVTENRMEWSERQSRYYERPAYQKIAQSKAFRNGCLSILPQDAVIQWREAVLKIGKSVVITDSVIDEKRSSVLRYAASQGLIVDRRAIDDLSMDQITGLGDAARSEEAGAFVNAARGLGLEVEQGEKPQETAEPQQEQKRRGRPPRQQAQQQSPPPPPASPPPTAEATSPPPPAAEATSPPPPAASPPPPAAPPAATKEPAPAAQAPIKQLFS